MRSDPGYLRTDLRGSRDTMASTTCSPSLPTPPIDEGHLFPNNDGRPLDYSNWRGRVWEPAVDAVGMADLNFHDLRRTNATAMVAEGVDVKTAQTRLGHSDPRLTLAIYAQATTEGDRSAASKLGARFMGRRHSDPSASSKSST